MQTIDLGSGGKIRVSSLPLLDQNGNEIVVYGGRVDVVNGVLTAKKNAFLLDGSGFDVSTILNIIDRGSYVSFEYYPARAAVKPQTEYLSDLFDYAGESHSDAYQIVSGTSDKYAQLILTLPSEYNTVSAIAGWFQEHPSTIVYELLREKTYQLNKDVLRTFLNGNAVWSDAGNVECGYSQNTASAIGNVEERLDENEANDIAAKAMIASIEPSSTATQTYETDDLIILDSILYKATRVITGGETLVPGINIEQTTIADILKQTDSDIDEVQNDVGVLQEDVINLNRQLSDVESALSVVESFTMVFLENGTATDNEYYKSLTTLLTNEKYYVFGITASESCKGRLSTYYLPNAAGKVEDVGEYELSANTEFVLYGYNPPSTVANVRLAKVTGSGIAPVVWTLKVYEIKEKANKSDLDAVESDLSADIALINSHVDDVVSVVGVPTKEYDGNSFTSDTLYFADGTPHTYSSPWCSTDFINCMGYTELSYTAEAFYSQRYNIDVAFVAFFDADKTMTASLKSSDYTNGAVSGTTIIPTDAVYVRVAGNDTKTRSLILKSNGYIKKVDQIWNNVETGLKICCIGDSLTEGVDGMSGNTPNVIAENYPYFMGKYLNATILNYGKAGTSPNTWWANLQSYGFTFDPSIDVVLIMFGTNGNMNVNTLATDVEPYNDWHDYANTGVGCYCKIIEYIMEQTSNHAQFILCTAPFNHYDEDDYYQRAKKSVDTTKAIAERYLLPVIDVYYESGLNDFNGDVFRPHDNLHFSAKGYHKLGTFIGSQTKAYLSRFSLDDEYNDELPIT